MDSGGGTLLPLLLCGTGILLHAAGWQRDQNQFICRAVTAVAVNGMDILPHAVWLRVGKLMGRGEGQGKPGAAAVAAVADSLSIRGTGHAAGRCVLSKSTSVPVASSACIDPPAQLVVSGRVP